MVSSRIATTLTPPLPAGERSTRIVRCAAGEGIFRKSEHEAAEWQAAMEALILVATSGGSTMFARIGIMRALNAGKADPAIVPPRKRARWCGL